MGSNEAPAASNKIKCANASRDTWYSGGLSIDPSRLLLCGKIALPPTSVPEQCDHEESRFFPVLFADAKRIFLKHGCAVLRTQSSRLSHPQRSRVLSDATTDHGVFTKAPLPALRHQNDHDHLPSRALLSALCHRCPPHLNEDLRIARPRRLELLGLPGARSVDIIVDSRRLRCLLVGDVKWMVAVLLDCIQPATRTRMKQEYFSRRSCFIFVRVGGCV